MRFLFLLLLFPAFCLYGQELPGLKDTVVDVNSYIPRYVYRSPGISYKSTRDKALSPLLFQGPGATFSASSWKYNARWLWQSVFGAELHLLRNGPGSSQLSSTGFSYRLSSLRELSLFPKTGWRFFVGPEASMFLNMRLHSRNVNNIAAYDWATTIGTAALLSKEFSLWNRKFILSNGVRLPLFYLYARPPYAWGIPPPVYEEQDAGWKEAFQLGSLNNIIMMENQVNLDFYLPKRKKGKLLQQRAFRIAYTWNYFQVNTKNKLQTGGHALTISRVMTF